MALRDDVALLWGVNLTSSAFGKGEAKVAVTRQ